MFRKMAVSVNTVYRMTCVDHTAILGVLSDLKWSWFITDRQPLHDIWRRTFFAVNRTSIDRGSDHAPGAARLRIDDRVITVLVTMSWPMSERLDRTIFLSLVFAARDHKCDTTTLRVSYAAATRNEPATCSLRPLGYHMMHPFWSCLAKRWTVSHPHSVKSRPVHRYAKRCTTTTACTCCGHVCTCKIMSVVGLYKHLFRLWP